MLHLRLFVSGLLHQAKEHEEWFFALRSYCKSADLQRHADIHLMAKKNYLMPKSSQVKASFPENHCHIDIDDKHDNESG